MKNRIRPPVKIDELGRVIKDPKSRVHSWRLNVPASITGTRKQRLFFATETETKKHAAELLEARVSAGGYVDRLKARGMSIIEALEYALANAPTKGSVSIDKACEAFLADRKAHNCKESGLPSTMSSDPFGIVEFSHPLPSPYSLAPPMISPSFRNVRTLHTT